MADISIDYASIDTVNGILTGAVNNTVPKLTSLQAEVTALLTADGGLWLVKSSPVLSKQYSDFNTSITTAVNNIISFAHQFSNIASQLQAMDAAISSS
ncbi:WXG100 family type VII secretion target [Frankia sp. AiPs1]|uniref:hypothetical protein n=1 Tax=Frankia sp. AiPa1 TaxID=573492 RepID=UPI00202B8AEF|nr:hypothetical protein [Frankia sp. AiPa1]MCL9760817.1 hypothetical protein [Frankia sp. AiPa1]